MEDKYRLVDVHPRVLEEYERYYEQVGEDPFSDCVISVLDVLKAHFLIADYFLKEGEGIGGVGPKDLNMLFSAVSRQTVGFGNVKKMDRPCRCLCNIILWAG